MERKKHSDEGSVESLQRLSDDDYWESASKGFDFSEEWSSSAKNSKLSSLFTMRKNDELNQYDLLRCAGLNEVAENKTSSEELWASHILSVEEEIQAQKLAKSFNPLEFHLKENLEKKSLTAAQTIRNIVLGLDFNLKPFKAKEQKLELLKAAVDSHDGNAILVVVMFLKNTLKKSIFQRELGNFPDAVNMYLSYLNEDHEVDELTNMMLLLNKPEDAAMLKYDAAILTQSPDRKLKLIENCLNTHFQVGSVHRFLRETVLEHKTCIKDQIVLEEHTISSEENDDITSKLFEELTGKKELLDSSVMCNLIFCLLYFYNVAKIAFISPSNIRSRYNLSQKQYTWCALRTLAATNKWSEIEELFLSKNWLRTVKMRSCIGFIRVLEVLSKRGAPPEVMKKYISCLESQDTKLFFAKKYKCHSLVIEILKKNRDRLGLIEYKATLPPHSVDYCTATTILNNEPVNWRN
ncbi:unnamed protein product [Larinioides sclopetarius]|uniref:Vps16 C-terminal domain-containing protein n=1 Tax=Larinioides sclopetarius TaxID=280406 RepID=A0AAV1YXH9_9ARAC